MIDRAARVASTVQGEAVSIDPAVEADPVIWIARLRTGLVVIFRVSGSRAFRAAALIDPVEMGEGLAVIASAAVEALAAVIASVVAGDLAAVALGALADLAVEDSAVFAAAGDDEINAWNFPILFLEKLKPQTNQLKERYEKTVNIDKYHQHRHGPDIRIRSDYRQRE
jgi:hypothetical protein